MKAVEAEPWGAFASLEDLAAAPLQDGRFTVLADGGRFEGWLLRQPGPLLWVLLSAARDPEVSRLPKFDRWSWAQRFPGSVLCISDPTLYLDAERMRIGWYVGTSAHDWQATLAALVRTLAARLDLPTRQVVAYGSSAGGFASLMLAARLGDATAVAINPQTDVLCYSRSFVEHLLLLAFEGRDDAALSTAERQRLSAVDLYARTPEVRCLYVQNRQDRVHVVRHFRPFAAAVGLPTDGGSDRSGNLQAMLYDDERGHAPEPLSIVREVIQAAARLARAPVVQRPLAGDRFVVDHAPLAAPFAAAQIGLGPARARTRRGDAAADGPADEPAAPPLDLAAGLDPRWRGLDGALSGAEVNLDALREAWPAVDAWLDDVVADPPGHLAGPAAWSAPQPAARALRLAMLLSIDRAGTRLWPEARRPVLDEVFDRHLRHLLERVGHHHAAIDPVELLALAALLTHIDGAAPQHYARIRWQAGVERALDAQFTPDGVHRSHSPRRQRGALRAWQRCHESGWFEGSALDGLLRQVRAVSRALRWPDGRMLPLGDTPRMPPAATAPRQAARAGIERWSGEVLARGPRPEAQLLHLMAGNRQGHPPHDDALSVLWYDGVELLADPGAGVGPQLERAASHNTVAIAGGPRPGRGGVSCRLVDAREAGGRVHLTARKTDKRWQARHVRHVVHLPGRWLLLVDALMSTSARDWTRWLHFGPGIAPAAGEGEGWRLADGRRLTVATGATGDLRERRAHGDDLAGAPAWLAEADGPVAAWALGHATSGERATIATLLALDDAAAGVSLDGADALVLAWTGPDGAPASLRLRWDLERCDDVGAVAR